jgi:hypothetical protein
MGLRARYHRFTAVLAGSCYKPDMRDQLPAATATHILNVFLSLLKKAPREFRGTVSHLHLDVKEHMRPRAWIKAFQSFLNRFQTLNEPSL